ncbi:DEAD-box ATP-dependent RNA helicase 17 isoform X1 [Arachis ipaensis]|uniref:DEAD-box ATP-dependent RNA helicase 17 isoform X1 n=1 Tax=Arachis ipaensis TaxID=130454 RepID=UPI000A2B5C3F|nr:DEAD-box ATP-dependent RNA helicase 17 isoform X1 [Arachis ipaensis]XP_020975357.1 DEAD-box ATP-dependent RNA helicase 17 isoform X1 [Arachis ipaensis]XP_020975358.1 DEAD-box ATP-dependent RNA helicase 17 isoform X1 [Arachis ipaensis]
MGMKKSEKDSKKVMENKKNEKKDVGSAASNATIENDSVFASCSFSSLGLRPSLCDELREFICFLLIEKLGFEVPTLVQAQAIPVILAGRHALINAATGTGKTVAYLAPLIHHLQNYDTCIQRSDGTFALVLVPTRELCLQVYEILQKLLHRFHWIVPGYVMGGENRSKEKARLRKGISILIATPGRLLDHLKNTSSFLYTKLRWIIFDEADRILELGFGQDIQEILHLLGSRKAANDNKESTVPRNSEFQRQNLLFSATLNEKVNHLAKISLHNPVMIGLEGKTRKPISTIESINPSESDEEDEVKYSSKIPTIVDYKIPTQLIQRYVRVPCGSRLAVLLSILKHLFERDTSQKVVVFFSTCDAVDFHHSLLSEFHFSTDPQTKERVIQMFLGCQTFRLHGNMEHEDRRSTFQAFKTEKSALLLSTDVSARGLDFPKVRCIIQYDSPGEATEYVHRVGRTARLGERGESLLFLQPVEIDYLQDLEKHGVSLAEYPLLKVLDNFTLHGHNKQVKKSIFIDLHPWVLCLQKALESFIISKPKMDELARKGFCSWVRAYTAHRGELKRIFMIKKLHLGHVAKSFALKQQPSLVGQSFQKQNKKRKRFEKKNGLSKKRKVARVT